MTRHEAVEILEEVKTLDDTMFAYSQAYNDALDMAIEALKAQEPRVMTLGDLRDIGYTWDLNTPPYLWMDINPSYRWTTGFWVAWRDIYKMINGLHPTYNADNYEKTWRCLKKKPTPEQMEATPWTQTNGLQ